MIDFRIYAIGVEKINNGQPQSGRRGHLGYMGLVLIRIQAYEHLGIRITNLADALQFYAMLGFKPDPEEAFPEYKAAVIVNEAGLRLNLIYSGDKQGNSRNILMDELEKYPGITHIAFVVERLDETIDELNAAGIAITEGPIKINKRRTACFIRDPDGNVIEFNQTAKDWSVLPVEQRLK